MVLVAILLGAITLLYAWLKWNYSYWKRNNVRGPEPRLFVGNTASALSMSEHFGIVCEKWYNEYSNEPYVGYYKMLKPAILVRDPDLLKNILTTNFHSFRNNDAAISKRYDSLSATNPFFKEDEEWKESRKTISPTFSQSKLKMVTPVMNSVGADFAKFIKSYPACTDLNAKEISTRFTTENVIKCAFSIKPGCFQKEEENEFLNPFSSFPNGYIEYIPVPFIPRVMDQWFRSFVKINKASRSKDSQSNDLFQTLLQIQEKNNGTETSGITLSYALYELARHPQCQEKVYEEVTRLLSKHGGNLTYEAIQEMNFLESVLLEASRLHPPALSLAKLCTKRYTLPKTSTQSKPTSIEPGTPVQIPILAIHMDPKNYPNPEEFKPERFSDEEQRNRNKYTFLTFGEGNRVCLGMRFALYQIKIAVAYIILNFNIKVSPSQKPIVIDPQSLLSYPKDGIILQFETR